MAQRKYNKYTPLHVACKHAGIDKEAYRLMLMDRYEVSSATGLDDKQFKEFLGFVMSLRKDKPKVWHGRPAPAADKKPMINKIIKLSDLLGKLGGGKAFLSYADGIAKEMFFRGQDNVELVVEMLSHEQLRKVIQALMYQCKRDGVELR